MSKSKMRLPAFIMRFLKVGVIGFGGGSALIPVVRNEVVEQTKAMSEEDYLKHTVIANITPGALPVKLGATCGSQLTGIAGSLTGAYAVMLPGCFFTVLLVALFASMDQSALNYLNYASIGITVFIVFLLLHYVSKTVKTGAFKVNLIICLISFIATAGKEVREIIITLFGLEEHALGTPILDVPMIHVMILAFYLIFYLQQTARSNRKYIGIIIGIGYALLNGKQSAHWAYAKELRLVILALIVISLIEVIIYSKKQKKEQSKEKVAIKLSGKIIFTMLIFLLIPVLVVVITGITGSSHTLGEKFKFLTEITVSTLTSFGGGEAYVAVADSVFVSGGYIPADIFYSRIVPVANALPGPILIKIASGIGFIWGQDGGNMKDAVAIAISSATLATGACCSVALLVLNFYESLKNSQFILSLKQYILPVICGTLLSTTLSMIFESMKITSSYGLSSPVVFVVMVICIIITMWLNKKFKMNDLVLLIGWIVVSLGVMSLILK